MAAACLIHVTAFDLILIAHCFPLIASYIYILTPSGIKSKMQLSRDFLKRKLDEYEMLKIEIEELKRDIEYY